MTRRLLAMRVFAAAFILGAFTLAALAWYLWFVAYPSEARDAAVAALPKEATSAVLVGVTHDEGCYVVEYALSEKADAEHRTLAVVHTAAGWVTRPATGAVADWKGKTFAGEAFCAKR